METRDLPINGGFIYPSLFIPDKTLLLFRCLVTSTLVESEMYADAGFDDILYGYPLIESHMKR